MVMLLPAVPQLIIRKPAMHSEVSSESMEKESGQMSLTGISGLMVLNFRRETMALTLSWRLASRNRICRGSQRRYLHWKCSVFKNCEFLRVRYVH